MQSWISVRQDPQYFIIHVSVAEIITAINTPFSKMVWMLCKAQYFECHAKLSSRKDSKSIADNHWFYTKHDATHICSFSFFPHFNPISYFSFPFCPLFLFLFSSSLSFYTTYEVSWLIRLKEKLEFPSCKNLFRLNAVCSFRDESLQLLVYKDNTSVWQMYFLFSASYFQILFLDLFLLYLPSHIFLYLFS